MINVEARPSTPFKNSHLLGRNEVCPQLEKVILPKESIAFRLANRYLAIQILESVFRIANTLKPYVKDSYDANKVNKLLGIAAAQAEIGEDPISIIKIATKLIADADTDALARPWASRIAAYAGDEKLALELAEKASEHTNQWPLRYTANVLKERGRDSKLFLDKAAELADTNKAARKGSVADSVCNFAALARTMHEHNRDPKPWLKKAETALRQTDEKFWTYNSLANAYAAIGDYVTAKSLVKNIVSKPDETAFAKRITLSHIAHRQAKNGDIDDAVKTAYESGFPDIIAVILMKKAYLQAKKGEDPSETLTRALTFAKQEKPGWAERDTTVAYSTAGRILAIAGKNPDEMFKTTTQRIIDKDKHKKPEYKSDVYKHLAMDMFASGKDGHLILDFALSEESRLHDPSMLNDILDAAIACGYDGYFNTIMGRLDSYKKQYNRGGKTEIDSWKIDFLTKIAKFRGENSLTREEIAKLSKEDIQEIKKSGFPVVKEALAYFKKT